MTEIYRERLNINADNKILTINILNICISPIHKGVKNDEHLIKMLAIVQRMEGGGKSAEADFFDPEELAKLMEQSEELGKGLDKEQSE